MVEETTVVNIHHRLPYDVYIGRGSKWGNPFTHLEGTTAKYKVGTREEAVEAYWDYLFSRPDLINALHELKGKSLGCYCHPHACHGHILAMLANLL